MGSEEAPALTIALPKGRTLAPVTKLLAGAGLTGADGQELAVALDEKSRALVRRARLGEHLVHMLLLKPDDVPTYVEYGTAGLGVVGRDVLAERDIDVYAPVDLRIGRCRLCVCGPVGPVQPLARMPRIATKYPRLAAHHFAGCGVQVEIVNVQSSVELAPLTGLADLIVDLVETGKTLAENGLEVKEDVLTVSTLLIANRASYKLRPDVAGALVRALRHGVPASA
jgi:ATP phosphoribosyltransferase